MKSWISVYILLVALSIGLHGEPIQERFFDQEAIADFKSDADFDYSESRTDSGSLISLLLATIFDQVLAFFEVSGIGWMTPWIFRLLIFLVIFGLILYLVRSRYGSLLTHESSVRPDRGFVSSMVQKEDYAKLLEESVQEGAYKLAIRYLYLKSLQMLNNQGRLKIEQWKAPYDYMKELSETERPVFQQLTDLFETTWYGDYTASKESYQKGLEASQKLANG